MSPIYCYIKGAKPMKRKVDYKVLVENWRKYTNTLSEEVVQMPQRNNKEKELDAAIGKFAEFITEIRDEFKTNSENLIKQVPKELKGAELLVKRFKKSAADVLASINDEIGAFEVVRQKVAGQEQVAMQKVAEAIDKDSLSEEEMERSAKLMTGLLNNFGEGGVRHLEQLVKSLEEGETLSTSERYISKSLDNPKTINIVNKIKSWAIFAPVGLLIFEFSKMIINMRNWFKELYMNWGNAVKAAIMKFKGISQAEIDQEKQRLATKYARELYEIMNQGASAVIKKAAKGTSDDNALVKGLKSLFGKAGEKIKNMDFIQKTMKDAADGGVEALTVKMNKIPELSNALENIAAFNLKTSAKPPSGVLEYITTTFDAAFAAFLKLGMSTKLGIASFIILLLINMCYNRLTGQKGKFFRTIEAYVTVLKDTKNALVGALSLLFNIGKKAFNKQIKELSPKDQEKLSKDLDNAGTPEESANAEIPAVSLEDLNESFLYTPNFDKYRRAYAYKRNKIRSHRRYPHQKS